MQRKQFGRSRLLLFSIGLLFCNAEAANETLIPFDKGCAWVYHGHMQSQQGKSDKVTDRDFRLKEELVEVFRQKGLRAALIKGHPNDVDPFEGKVSVPGRYLFIEIQGQKLFLLQDDKVDRVLPLLRKGKMVPVSELSNDELIVGTPLSPGCCFAQDPDYAANMKKQHMVSSMYGWSVDSKGKAKLAFVKMSDSTRTRLQNAADYELSYQTNPSTQTVSFVPGLGFLKYDYKHHGTIANYQLQLEEFIGK